MRLALLLLLLVGWTAATEVICYWGAWTHYRNGDGKITADDLDASKCTIYIYAFAKLDPTTYTMAVYDNWLDIDLQSYNKFVSMKTQNPGLKVLIALGGWNDSQGSKYSTMLASPSLRANFVTKAVQFLQTHGFDGLDLDYEYPSSADKANFALWCQELHAAFQPHGFILTAAVSASAARIAAGYDVPSLANSLDMINVMTYDFHGSWVPTTADHHAAFQPRASDAGAGLDVQSSMEAWKSAGAPAAKLAVGVPIYGRSWSVPGASKTPPAAASGAGAAGEYSGEPGSLTYLEICKRVNAGWTVVQDGTGKIGPYAYSGAQWVGYDDLAMVATKTQWAVAEGFGGVMVWDVGSSDARNVCGDGAWPVLTTIQSNLGSTGTTAATTSTVASTTTAGTGSTTSTSTTSASTTSASTTSASTTTVSPGAFVCPANGLFPDPADCQKYFNCWMGTPYHYTCAVGTLFDTGCSCCNWDNLVTCSTTGSSTTAATTTQSTTQATTTTTQSTTASTTASTTTSPGGSFVCPGDGLFRDPADCQSYYNCWAGTGYHYSCPAGTLFDTGCSCCNWDNLVTCP